MRVSNLLNSRWTKRTSALTALASAVRAFANGRPKRGALLVAAGMLSYRWSTAGVLVQLAVEGLDRR